MKKNLLYLCLFLFLFQGNHIRADISSRYFFRMAPDAVSRSIGGPNPAYSIGAVDLFINPSLLSQHNQREIQFTNIINLLSNRYMSFAYSVPLNEANYFAMGLTGLDTSPLRPPTAENIRMKESHYYLFSFRLAYARDLSPFSIGAGLMYLTMGEKRTDQLKNIDATGYNLGISYIARPNLQIGFFYQSPFSLEWEKENRERYFGKKGIGFFWSPYQFSSGEFSLLLSIYYYAGMPLQINSGVVITSAYHKFGLRNLSLRAGLGNFDLNSKSERIPANYLTGIAPFFTIGAGLGIDTGSDWGISLDYCFQVMEYISNQHIITTRLNF